MLGSNDSEGLYQEDMKISMEDYAVRPSILLAYPAPC